MKPFYYRVWQGEEASELRIVWCKSEYQFLGKLVAWAAKAPTGYSFQPVLTRREVTIQKPKVGGGRRAIHTSDPTNF